MKDNSREITYTPAEVSRLTIEQLERLREYPGIFTGIPSLDKYIKPGRPGELITIIGRPGHMKTGFMMRWARYLADNIIEEGKEETECIVFVSWEMAVEELTLYDFAFSLGISADDVASGIIPLGEDSMMKAIAVRSTTPIYVVGPSLEKRRNELQYSMPDVMRALKYIEDEWNLMPRAVFLDYLQAMAPPFGGERRIQVEENVRLAKQAALEMACPVIMGCQARREVDTRKIKIPRQHDGMESSAIEHKSDKVIGLWKPSKTEQMPCNLPEPWGGHEVTDNILFAGISKQRFGPAGKIFPLYTDPGKNIIGAMNIAPDGSWGK